MKNSVALEESSDLSCGEKVFKRDSTLFRDYIDNTTAHGVSRIFSNRSLFRRLFWLVVVLAASAVCLSNCIDRIMFLASRPTSTAITITRRQPIDFPAVTFCNLNFFTRDGLRQFGILSEADRLLNLDPYNLLDLTLSDNCSTSTVPLEELIVNAGHEMSDFIAYCSFMGRDCVEEDFVPLVTTSGLCYTFNPGNGKPVLQNNGTGVRQGLSVILDIHQSQYVSTPSLDAGVRVAVHPQSVPPIPLDQGISAPPGTNAFIGLIQRNTVDKTALDCKSESDISKFNYLQSKFNYSVNACSLDCFLTQVAYSCGCSYLPHQYPPEQASFFAALPNCTFEDICCLQLEAFSPVLCDCPSACETQHYATTTSYSTLPALYTQDVLESLLDASLDEVREDAISVNVYFESQNVETFTTSFSYSVVALLSDIGGQLGLFLGVSVISVMEFVLWILDEFTDRCLCSVFSSKNCCRLTPRESGSKGMDFGERNTKEMDNREMNSREVSTRKADMVRQNTYS